MMDWRPKHHTIRIL